MIDKKLLKTCLTIFVGLLLGISNLTANPATTAGAIPEDEAALQRRVHELATQLEQTQAQLTALRARNRSPGANGSTGGATGEAATPTTAAAANTAAAKPPETPDKQPAENRDLRFGPLRIGGAIRANYTIGDYPDQGRPSRGGDGGNFELDTFRLNAALKHDNLIGSAEYRWYDGYNFVHHVWLGYEDAVNRVEAGLTRAPFGPGPYGVSQSWFFDQHYYVGLSDDMDPGVNYTRKLGNLTLDAAWFLRSEWNGNGASRDSARYSYDVVRREDGTGYDEENRFNLRAVYRFDNGGDGITTDLGASAQFGLLDGKGGTDDGHHYAASVHMVNTFRNWTLATQATRYEYSLKGADLVPMGAYDYAADVAAKAWVLAASLGYRIETKNIPWLDYVLPYVEYSSIIKDESRFNNSDMVVIGAAWASGGWYIYTDLAFSNGNFFVGDTGDFGANTDNDWQSRFNINFGYYF
ncbi:hypothetical protein OpiT1DRAFT_02315 [Opitutaceae bacterium TAV1]|nr:hypothetical protein OpiT1DRAFT_02315 [Opitutaceae bacterium TAV1]